MIDLMVPLKLTAVVGLVSSGDLLDAVAGIRASEALDDAAHARPLEGQRFDAATSMDEFRREIRRPNYGSHEAERFHTIAGFVLHQLKHLPTPGTRFAHDGLEFVVEDMDKQRITSVLVRFPRSRAVKAARQ